MSSRMPIKYRQPDRRLLWGGPFDPVLLMRRDIDEIAGFHLHHPILKEQPCSAFQNDHPLMLVLIVPKPFGRCVAVGDDALDTDVGGFEQCGEKLVGQLRGKFSEEVRGTGHGFSFAKGKWQLAHVNLSNGAARPTKDGLPRDSGLMSSQADTGGRNDNQLVPKLR